MQRQWLERIQFEQQKRLGFGVFKLDRIDSDVRTLQTPASSVWRKFVNFVNRAVDEYTCPRILEWYI